MGEIAQTQAVFPVGGGWFSWFPVGECSFQKKRWTVRFMGNAVGISSISVKNMLVCCLTIQMTSKNEEF